MGMQEKSQGYKNLTISSGIREAAMRNPRKTALICGTKSLTFRSLVERINRVANMVIDDCEMTMEDTAAIIAPNCIEYFEIVCGISEIGAAIATPSPKLNKNELSAICNDAKAKILFLHSSCKDQIDAGTLDTVKKIVLIGGDYEEWISAGKIDFESHHVSETATFSIPYTSGTTGKPKGVMVSHRSRVLGFFGCAVEYGVFGPEDYFYAIAPLCHGAGFAMAMGSIFMGGTCEIAEAFNEEETLRVLHEGNATGVFFVPTHFHRIFELPKSVLEKYRGHNLKAIMSNAAALPQATKEKVVEYFGDGLLHELYGSTEAGYVSTLRPKDQLRKTQCVGKAFPNTMVRLLDENGEQVGPNQIGELFSASPMLFNGYWGKPKATDEAFHGDWVSVGDLARFDEEGYLYIVGRKSDMIISGGINIYPREIEEVMALMPEVSEAAVIGVPDKTWGERLIAFVVSRSGDRLSSDAIVHHCRNQLAGYKVPREVYFIDELPRNPSGKVLKRELSNLIIQKSA